MTVISKFLGPSFSPSPQVIVNCTLLACVMLGVPFDNKEIVRVDKSSTLHQLAQSLLAQVQDVHALDGSVCRAWDHIEVIYHVLELGLPCRALPNTMWMLNVYRKIVSRATLSQHNDSDSRLLQPLTGCDSIKSHGKAIPSRQKTSIG
ncbi:hypothetical protein BDR04DRAFT_495530 [Suillus decipiens]|nr:hypothetical protein BDR04DRAFT_495530 [Suillus decipiens]